MSLDGATPAGGDSSQGSSKEPTYKPETNSRFLPRTVGIYGPRSAGKTCYLATALLGVSTSSNCAVLLGDEDSRNLLLKHWQALEKGELPPATEMAISRISGSVVITAPAATDSAGTATSEPNPAEQGESAGGSPAANLKLRVPFTTADFSGLLSERGETGKPELTLEFQRWLETADCLLFFLAVDQLENPAEAEARLLEVDALLSRLAEKSPTGHVISQPIAVLLTKWDLASDLTGSLDEERQKVRQFLSQRAGDIGKQVCEKIEALGQRVVVFPVSAFGGHVDGKPVHPLKPFNLHEPLVWALLQADHALFEKTRIQAESALKNKPLWRGYTPAIRGYQRLIDDYGIKRGPVYDQIQKELAPLRLARRRRTARLAISIAAVVLFLVALGSYRLDRATFLDILARLDAPRDPYPLLEQLVTEYQKALNPWAALLGHKRQVDDRWSQYLDNLNRARGELEKLRKRPVPSSLPEAMAHYRELANRCADFLARYRESPPTRQVASWEEEAKREALCLEFPLQVAKLRERWDEAKRTKKDADLLSVTNLLDEANKLSVPSPARSPEVKQALIDHHALCQELQSTKTRLEKEQEEFVKTVNLWKQNADKALAASPVDLHDLEGLRKEGDDLSARKPPEGPTVTEARNTLEVTRRDLRDRLQAKKREASEWVANAHALEEAVQKALDTSDADTKTMEDLGKQVRSHLDAIPKVRGSAELDEAKKSLDSRLAELDEALKLYQEFDKAYEELTNRLAAGEPREQLKAIREFKDRHPQDRFPGRRQRFAKLENMEKDLLVKIDDSGWKEVEEQFKEFHTRAIRHEPELQAVENLYDQFYDAAQKYLRQTDPAPGHAEDCSKRMEEALRLLDDAEWKDVETFAGKNDQDHEGIAEKAQGYLTGNDGRLPADKRQHKPKAEERIRRALADRWKELYRDFYERASGVSNAQKLKEARDSARRVDESIKRWKLRGLGSYVPDKTPARVEKVRDWSNWADPLVEGKVGEVEITIKQLNVNPRAPQVRLHIWLGDGVNDKVWRSPKFFAPANPPQEPLKFPFAKGYQIQVQLELNDGWISNSIWDSAPLNIDCLEVFVTRGGEVSLGDQQKQNRATLVLKCPKLTPPPLDPPD